VANTDDATSSVAENAMCKPPRITANAAVDEEGSRLMYA
jgi:hypothetical protein